MLCVRFSLCCIIKSSPKLQYLHFYVTPDVSISQNVNSLLFPPCCTYAPHSLFQWLCHELCNLLLCTSFTAIMSWIQNGHSCPLFSDDCLEAFLPFLIWALFKRTNTSRCTPDSTCNLYKVQYIFFPLKMINTKRNIQHKWPVWMLMWQKITLIPLNENHINNLQSIFMCSTQLQFMRKWNSYKCLLPEKFNSCQYFSSCSPQSINIFPVSC